MVVTDTMCITVNYDDFRIDSPQTNTTHNETVQVQHNDWQLNKLKGLPIKLKDGSRELVK